MTKTKTPPPPRPPRGKAAAPPPPQPKPQRTRGERVIAFIEEFCIVPEGMLMGQPMRLEPFQTRFILAIYDKIGRAHV